MTIKHGSGAAVYINAVNFSHYLNQEEIDATVELVDVTGFKSGGAHAYWPGHKSVQGTFTGLFDPSADSAIRAALGTSSSLWTELPAGDTTGAAALSFAGKPASYKQSVPVGDAVAVAIQATGDTALEVGRVACPLSKLTNTINPFGDPTIILTTPLDDTASSTSGASSYLHVFSGSGFGTLQVDLQHSSDNFATDIETFVSHTAVPISLDGGTLPSYERVVGSGTLNRYVRSQITLPLDLSFAGLVLHHSYSRWP